MAVDSSVSPTLSFMTALLTLLAKIKILTEKNVRRPLLLVIILFHPPRNLSMWFVI